MADPYHVDIICTNCGYQELAKEMPFGHRVVDAICPKCGCFDLTKCKLPKKES